MNQRGKDVLEKIKGKLIVSCQARVGWPMYGADIMAAFAAGPPSREEQQESVPRV